MAAAQALSGYAKSVRIVLLPGLPAGGGDLTDWLEDTAALPRHDRDLLIKLCLQAPPWAPDPAADASALDSVEVDLVLGRELADQRGDVVRAVRRRSVRRRSSGLPL